MLIALSFTFFYILEFNVESYQQAIKAAIPIILCISSLALNFICYSALKKKFNFETEVYFYGVGFTSCCFAIVFFAFALHGPIREEIESVVQILYILPFILLYYSYATLVKKKEERIPSATTCLMVTTFVIFAILTIFEMVKYQIPYVGIFLLFFGLYFAYCLIYKKYVLNLQGFAWSPFLLPFILFWYLIIKFPPM